MGLAEQADVLYDKTDDEILDTVILGGAAETEHVEIALYEDLITQARAMGERRVVCSSSSRKRLGEAAHPRGGQAGLGAARAALRRQMSAVGSAPQPSGFGDTGRQ